MSSCSQNNAVAIFGSAARGDNDAFSDRDLLLVSDDECTLREMKCKYDSAGWSCTAYSWKRLQRASDQGSLFVQHLKLESKIVSDSSDRLAHLLAQYSTRVSYERESNGAASLLGNLMQHLPQCDAGPMWTLDVLSVGFRSLAVAKLADCGIYAFANSSLIDGLARIGMISRREGSELANLRCFKSLYRRGVIDRRISWREIFDWIKLIDGIFAIGLSAQRVRILEMIELALVDDNTGHADSDWYTRSRRIESALWMLEPRLNADRAEFGKQRERLFRIVKSPNSYARHFTSGYKTIQASLSDLAGICTV